ncbi:MAG TPA: type II toxin-antitoxin system VapC family toxin [Solirubrobacterales bacterium]|jgi:PIN domain nuclease of toxin-antitoxin system|nr:type II toxin-antitoxin system VapC family toxin [Solirubrobacterales bacterium]
MSSVLLDTHVVHWWSSEPERVSHPARQALETADELLIAAVSWYELAWLARHGRIALDIPIRSWLEELSAQARTVGLSPAVAETAVALPDSFPGDPADRQIYATAIEHGVKLLTKDQAITEHDKPRSLVVW